METKLGKIADKSAHERKPEFTALYHLLNKEMLIQCHKKLDGNKALGIDQVSKEEYAKNLEQNIEDLVTRLKNKAYKPQPTLRVYMDKGNGKKRPLGLAAYEDKIVQLGLKRILEAVYEPKFLENMYGFRPNRDGHMAIKDMCSKIVREKINYIVDADIKGYFENMKHDWIIEFVKYYIKDPNILNLIEKYLKAGVMEDGLYTTSESGAVQGGIISPVLSNIYMHQVLNLWYERQWRKTARGDSFLLIYADDYIAGFQHKEEAESYFREMQERMKRFGLEIESSKSRLLEFGRYGVSI